MAGVRKTLYFPDEVYERLAARAGELERSESWCVQRAVEAWLADSSVGQSRGDDPRVVGSSPAPPAAPRASAPAFARVTQLGVPAKPIPRRTR